MKSRAEIEASLPPIWGPSLRAANRRLVEASAPLLVVLDDDPTGTQTVYDVAVLTEWTESALCTELERASSGFYILTNSRSLPEAEAVDLNREVARNLRGAADRVGRSVSVVSRSDSTLRGHFPAETDALGEALGPFDATFVIPFFEAGGRLTVDDTHYVADGDQLIPASETPFAQDKVFGYRNANLRLWIEEKTQGRIAADDVVSIPLETLRAQGPDGVEALLNSIPHGSYVIVNAIRSEDIDVFVAGVLRPSLDAKRFLFRTGADFVSARMGLEKRPTLTRSTLIESNHPAGGLMVVGSYVPMTTEQLERLFSDHPGLNRVEVSVDRLLDASRYDACVADLTARVDASLAAGEDVVLYTERELRYGASESENLGIGARVSQGLVEVVRGLTARPRFLIAKGGVTSSDVATKALEASRAEVMGAILPGVPVWRMGAESRMPGLPYIVFPGNVGGSDGLSRAYEILKRD